MDEFNWYLNESDRMYTFQIFQSKEEIEGIEEKPCRKIDLKITSKVTLFDGSLLFQ